VACTQGRISYNTRGKQLINILLWLALRGGSVTIKDFSLPKTVSCGLHSGADQLQYFVVAIYHADCCGLHSGADQLQCLARKPLPCKGLRVECAKIIRVGAAFSPVVSAFFPRKSPSARTAYP
jgi:hypothetical protein